MLGKVLQKYRWEATHIAAIGGVIALLTVITHLPGQTDRESHPTPRSTPTVATGPKADVPHPPPRHTPPPSDPREVVVGPNSISGQYTLLGIDRKRLTSDTDELTLRLHIVSHAIADLVTPFESAMLELCSRGIEPINPQHTFSRRIPAGEKRDEDIVFRIPSDLTLDRLTLRIHYYNEEQEIPLRLFSRVDRN